MAPPKNPNPFEEDELTVGMGEVDRRALIEQSRKPSAKLPVAPARPVPPPPKVASPSAPAKSSASSQQLPAVGAKPSVPPSSASSQRLPVVGAKPSASSARLPAVGAAASSFTGQTSTRRDLLLGRPGLVAPVSRPTSMSQEELTVVASRFDGQKPSPSVEVPAAQLKPVDAETTSVAGARLALLTRAVIDQFAVDKNSRYSVGECGHVFIGDFTRAMGCPTPRFKRDVELSLEQVYGWLRQLSNGEGWMRVSVTARAVELAAKGYPVLAVPKSAKVMLLAVARPQETSPDGNPLLVSACSRARGGRLTTMQAFGIRQADYYFHE